jgi:hypothetical protein
MKKQSKDPLKHIPYDIVFRKIVPFFTFEDLTSLKLVNRYHHKLIEFAWKSFINEYTFKHISRNPHIQNLMTFICKYRDDHKLKEIVFNNFSQKKK